MGFKKGLITVGLGITVFINTTYAYTQSEKIAADLLSYKDIIVVQESGIDYKLDANITRREMAKVTIKLSNVGVSTTCNGSYSDFDTNDWGCKYAESGLQNNFFAANDNFNPNESISKIEALKMVMKGKGIKKEDTSDWREGYVIAAIKAGLLESSFTDYNAQATRGWIFIMAWNAIQYSEDLEIQMFNDLLNI